jgi:predicted O-methyltransferase YrrM
MRRASRRARRAGGAGGEALARALGTAGRNGFGPDERAWIDRVEARRREIPEAATDAEDIRNACPYWSIPRVWGRLLFALVRELRPASCLEMGIGFGMSAAYQGAALELNGAGSLTCLDREETLAALASETFETLGLQDRVALRMGAIGETLPSAAAEAAPIDYAYIDAEHTEAATVENFERILPHLAPGAVVVVDDIRVDAGMRRAWERIRSDPGSALALDLRRVGIVVAAGRSSESAR